MAQRRSPTKASITCADGNELIATRGESQSQPDLRQLWQPEAETNKVTFRKRKTPDDDFSDRFDQFETKIMSILTNMSQTQTDKLDKISQQVSAVTNQISQIKITTDQLSLEQNRVKNELLKLESSKLELVSKIEALTNDIGNLRSSTSGNTQTTMIPPHVNMISEIHDRFQREKNIVVSGLQEINSGDSAERSKYDKQEVIKMIRVADPNCIEPIKCFRLGKYNSNKSRPIKVCFSSAETAKSILRNKNNIYKEINNIKFYSDQTPLQKEEMLKLRVELNKRTEEGEDNLAIKYVKGVPKIIKNPSKN